MASFNKVILIGTVTRDIELKHIQSGTSVCEVGLAINDKRKGKDGNWIEETTFVDVTLWGRTAEVAAEYSGKGKPLMVEGRLKLESWEKDGKKQSKLKVVGDTIQLLGGKGGEKREAEPKEEWTF
jgi:single-strand DNA-binding protein